MIIIEFKYVIQVPRLGAFMGVRSLYICHEVLTKRFGIIASKVELSDILKEPIQKRTKPPKKAITQNFVEFD